MSKKHQEPRTDYEQMLNREGLDCSVYACWEPFRAFVTIGGRKVQLCHSHALAQGTPENTEWVES